MTFGLLSHINTFVFLFRPCEYASRLCDLLFFFSIYSFTNLLHMNLPFFPIPPVYFLPFCNVVFSRGSKTHWSLISHLHPRCTSSIVHSFYCYLSFLFRNALVSAPPLHSCTLGPFLIHPMRSMTYANLPILLRQSFDATIPYLIVPYSSLYFIQLSYLRSRASSISSLLEGRDLGRI